MVARKQPQLSRNRESFHPSSLNSSKNINAMSNNNHRLACNREYLSQKVMATLMVALFLLRLNLIYSQTEIETFQAYQDLSIKIIHTSNWNLAIERTSSDLKVNPNSITALYFRGIAYYELKEYGKAILQFDKILELDHLNYDALKQKANCLYSLENYKDAIPIFTRLLLFNSEDFQVYLKRARAKYFLEDYSGALQDCNQAIIYSSKNLVGTSQLWISSSYCFRGEVKIRLLDGEGALNDFNKAIEIDSSNGIAYFERGKLRALVFDDKENGCLDLSRAGDLGVDVYDFISVFCK